MPISHVLDTACRLLYRGKLKELIMKYELNDSLRETYWKVYKIFVDKRVKVSVNGAESVFHISTYPEYRVVSALQGEERPIMQEIIDNIREDDIIWDIGANIGTFSCTIGDKLNDGNVFAFEPYPPNVEKLKNNLILNSIDSEVMPLALSDESGKITFHVVHTKKAGTQQGSIASDYADIHNTKEKVNVSCTTGDQLVANGKIPTPNIIKIDVEGAANKVITGISKVLESQKCRLVIVEPHGNYDNISQKLSNKGFEIDNIELAESRAEEPPTIFAYK